MGEFLKATLGCFGALFGTFVGAVAGYVAVLAKYETPTSRLSSGSPLGAAASIGCLLGAMRGLVLGAVGFSWISSRIWPNEQHKRDKNSNAAPIAEPFEK